MNISKNDRVWFLGLAGGAGARYCQLPLLRSILKKREKSEAIVIADSTGIGQQAANVLENVVAVNIPEFPTSFPHNPGLMADKDGFLEFPVWIDSWRESYLRYRGDADNIHDIIMNNLERVFHIEYGFALTKLIHLESHKREPSFISSLYAKVSGLEYDGGIPIAGIKERNKEVDNYVKSLPKPMILFHIGADKSPHDLTNSMIYRDWKVWSLKRWGELAQHLSAKYSVVQCYAGDFNPEISNVKSFRINSFDTMYQLLENCKFFVATDNVLVHCAASQKKKGIVLWGQTPKVWMWKYNQSYYVFNEHSCSVAGNCWQPGMYAIGQNGSNWICPNGYSCMKSITVRQVLDKIEKLEQDILVQPKKKVIFSE